MRRSSIAYYPLLFPSPFAYTNNTSTAPSKHTSTSSKAVSRMVFQKFTIPLILTLYYVLLAHASSFSRRQTCIVNSTVYTSFEEPLILEVQNKSYPPNLHNRAIYYTSLGNGATGPVKYTMNVHSNGRPPPTFSLHGQLLHIQQFQVNIRPSEYNGLEEVYFSSTPWFTEPGVLWSGYPGCNPNTDAVELELRPDGNRRFCAKPYGSDWGFYVQSGCKSHRSLPPTSCSFNCGS